MFPLLVVIVAQANLPTCARLLISISISISIFIFIHRCCGDDLSCLRAQTTLRCLPSDAHNKKDASCMIFRESQLRRFNLFVVGAHPPSPPPLSLSPSCVPPLSTSRPHGMT